MALELQSTDPELGAQLKAAGADGVLSPVEFQQLRDSADADAAETVKAYGFDVGAEGFSEMVLLLNFLSAADALVELMQRLALAARKSKLPEAKRDAVRAGIRSTVERQVAYIVAGHKSSTERL